MKTVWSTLTVLLALLATGCGSAEPTAGSGSGGSGSSAGSPTSSPSSPSTGATTGGSASSSGTCPSTAGFSAGAIRFLGNVDLEGTGHPDEVGVSAASATCQVLHLVVGGRAVSVPIASGPPVTSVYAVKLGGRTGDLLVTRQASPRGGFQTRIFAYAGGRVTEVTSQGRPLVPFVATDVPGQHVLVDCQGDQIVVTQATAEPAQGSATVQRTAYALDGASAARTSSSRTRGDVLVKPLAADAVFPSCRVG